MNKTMKQESVKRVWDSLDGIDIKWMSNGCAMCSSCRVAEFTVPNAGLSSSDSARNNKNIAMKD